MTAVRKRQHPARTPAPPSGRRRRSAGLLILLPTFARRVFAASRVRLAASQSDQNNGQKREQKHFVHAANLIQVARAASLRHIAVER